MTTTTNTARKYAVMISTGNGPYRYLVGWDDTYSSRADAKACAARASRNDGWQAKVVAMTADEAARNGW